MWYINVSYLMLLNCHVRFLAVRSIMMRHCDVWLLVMWSLMMVFCKFCFVMLNLVSCVLMTEFMHRWMLMNIRILVYMKRVIKFPC